MDLTAEQLSSERRSAARPGSAGHGDRERFRFHGKAGEYFRIWIVNLSLTILTLGIYSAWAKVRRNRYIYGNLELAGSRFDYLARPATILRGRLIALTLVGLYLGAQVFFSIGWVLLSVLLGLTIPWLLVRSRMFNMRYTAYRNIRFGFRPAYADSYKVVIGYGALSLITIGLAAPYVHYRRNHLIVDNTRFGNMNFRLHARVREFYLAYVLGAVLASALFVPLQVLGGESGAAGGGLPQLPITVLLPFLAVILLYYVVGQFVNAYVLRLTMNGTRIGTGDSGRPHVLGCDWTLAGMLCVYLTNAIAIALSLGLLVPWAQMRILRYQLNHTWLDVSETLDDVIAGQDSDVSSLGEEIGDLFDVDIGL
jgi:uncharacterized membrane protein YjgN (DUF898 family)